MKSYLSEIDIEHIKRAIQVEEKYKYINLSGKESNFSGFMIKQIRNIYKLSKKNPIWQSILESFECYSQNSMMQRKKAINRFVTVLKQELNPEKKEINTKENLYDFDVVMLKGVGPKFGYLLNKVGIFSVFDLISYYPKKYIDYSQRCKIRDLKEGENTTVYAKICSVKCFTTKRNLTVMKVLVRDETGSLELNFFYAKANSYMIEKYKSQFPLHSYIVISGSAKFDNYNHSMTIDKPQYQIIDETNLSEDNLNLGRIVPVYPLVENLNIKALRKAINNALEEYGEAIKNIVPDEITEKHNFYERKKALKVIHFPPNQGELDKARQTLVYEELFLLQMKMLSIRSLTQKTYTAAPIEIKEDGLVMKFIKGLPFKLTDAQKKQ